MPALDQLIGSSIGLFINLQIKDNKFDVTLPFDKF